jgi:hypothetical protein
MLFTIWLVIRIGVVGEPLVTISDTKMPDLDTCLARATEVLKKAEAVADGYDEFFVTCSIAKEPADPA